MLPRYREELPDLDLQITAEDDVHARRRKALALRVPEDWRRVLTTMGADFTTDEWAEKTGLDLEAIGTVIALAGLRVRRIGGRAK
jgi:hypothetical protein